MVSSHESQCLFRPLLNCFIVQIRAHPKSVWTVLQNVHFYGYSSLETAS